MKRCDSVESLVTKSFQANRPVLIAQLNSTDRAARQAAREAGLITAGVVPRGAYSAGLIDRFEAQEADSDSFRKADVANVLLAKDVAHSASARAGMAFSDRHAAAAECAVHVGLLYGLSHTFGKPSGAGTFKTSACLASPDEAYPKGYANLPKPDGLQDAMERGEPTFRCNNRLFLLDLRRETVAASAAALGAMLTEGQPVHSIVVSGPEQASIEGVNVGDRVHQTFSMAFARAWPLPRSAGTQCFDISQKPLHVQALEVVAALQADKADLEYLGKASDRAYYKLAQGEDTWFVKLYKRSPEAQVTAAKEQAKTQWAAGSDLAPACRPVPKSCCAVVTAYWRDGDLTRDLVRQPLIRREVTKLLGRLHSSDAAALGYPEKPANGPDWSAGALGHLNRLKKNTVAFPLTLTSLEARIDYLKIMLEAKQNQLNPCAGDPHYGNMLRNLESNEIKLIDWSNEAWNVMGYDIARFCYTSRIANSEIESVVKDYNDDTSGDLVDLLQVRHMIAMMNSDYLGYFSTGEATAQQKDLTSRCRDDEKYLPEMPILADA